MKSIEVVFKQGQMYEKETSRIVTLVDYSEAILVATHSRDIVLGEPVTNDFRFLDSSAKESAVKASSDRYARALKSGEKMYTWIPVGDNTRLAQVELLEDLYLFHKDSWKSDDAKMFACVCRVVEVDGIELNRDIKAHSVSDLYKELYLHFNLNKGNPSRNAFSQFFLDPNNRQTTLDSVRRSARLMKSKGAD